MDINMDHAGKLGSPPSTSSLYLNIAAFDSMPYPVAGDMYTDYYDDSMMAHSHQGYSDMGNAQEHYLEDSNEPDNSSFPQQQIYQHRLQRKSESTEPSTINTPGTPAIELKFEDLYDTLNLSGGERSTRRLSSNIHSRRRAQNRASQRAFRERKEQHVKEVEAKLAEVEAKYESLEEKYRATEQELKHLKAATSKESGDGDRALYNEQQFDAFLEDVFLYDANGGQTYGGG